MVRPYCTAAAQRTAITRLQRARDIGAKPSADNCSAQRPLPTQESDPANCRRQIQAVDDDGTNSYADISAYELLCATMYRRPILTARVGARHAVPFGWMSRRAGLYSFGRTKSAAT